MKNSFFRLLGSALLFGAVAAPTAQADPVILLNTQSQIQTAIANGMLAGITTGGGDPCNVSNLLALNQIYSSPIIGNTSLYYSPNISGGTPGLVSATQAAVNTLTVGGFSYCAGSDPDWNGYTLDTQFFFPRIAPPPPGIFTFTVAVIDVNDKIKYWQYESTALSPGFQNITLPLDAGAGAGGSNVFFQDPAFDLSQGLIIQFSYRGIFDAGYPPLPPTLDGSPPPRGPLWIGMPTASVTTAVVAVPEPGTVALTAAAGLSLLAFTRRRRALPVLDTGRG